MEILRRLETDGDQAQMESWTQVDGSDTGLGVVVPAVLPRHRIGLLVCLREADDIDWRLGLIRRIGRDAANRPSIGVALTRRRKGQPGRVIAIADKAQQRLCRRFRKLAAEHKPAPKIAVAIARELAGFLWAALQPAPISVK